MVTTEAVSQRHPALVMQVTAALAIGTALDTLTPTIVVEDVDGEIHTVSASEPVTLAEIVNQAVMMAGEFIAPVAMSLFPVQIVRNGEPEDAVALVTQDWVDDEVDVRFWLVERDEAAGTAEITLLGGPDLVEDVWV